MRISAEIARLDRFDLLILDDLSYVRRDQAETSVLFELIAWRYERMSLAITANQPFSGWDQVFPDTAMTLAAVDRLVHHSTIFELNAESYRRWVAARGDVFKAESIGIINQDKQVTPKSFPVDRNDADGGATVPCGVDGARGDASVPLRSTKASPLAKEQTKTQSKAKTTTTAN